MYYRRKVILALLQTFDGRLDKVSFQKLLFLFTDLQAKHDLKPSFHFVPYIQGCFSFQSYADMGTMKVYKQVDDTDKVWKKKDKADYLAMLNPKDKQFLLYLKNQYAKHKKELFDVFEKGLITPADFRRGVKKYIDREVSDVQIDEAWNSMLLDLPKERVQFLSELKKNHRLFLLSNTNEIHFNAFSNYVQKNFGKDLFSDLFDKAYFSHQVKMRKPDAEIFTLVLDEQNLRKEETLFIDDSFQHIESAKKIGLNVLFLQKGKTVLDVFNTGE